MLRALILLLCAVFATPALGKLPKVTLAELAAKSHLVCVGEVVTIEPGAMSPYDGMPSRRALIRLVKSLKGSLPQEVKVVFVPRVSEEASFVVGQRYVLFLKWSNGDFRTSVGSLGAREIVDDSIDSSAITGEPARLSIADLERKLARGQ